MKLSLSITTIVSIAATLGASEGLRVGSPFDNLQQTLNMKLGESKIAFGDKLDASKQMILETVGQIVNQPFNELPVKTKGLWQEMLDSFPDTVSSLQIETPPKKSSPKPDDSFDFHVTDVKLPNHKLRVKSTPEDLGVDTVKQYTGYLDVADEDKHFFYWFFESRNDPKNDPVILWLNGGPGCSSLTGLFFELGSSSIGPGLKPIYNPHSWNSNASVIYLDQPVNVGFSYSSQSVSSTVAAGKDVYAFLELFFKQFPEYNNKPFHIAGESYAGHYIPVFASEILSHEDRSFNLTSVLIGNGLSDPLTQYEYYEPMACGEGGEESVLDPEVCESMASSIPRCLSLIEACYETNSIWSCVPATIYCNNAELGPYQKTGRNVYDIRTMCEESSLCYKELKYVDQYLNLDEVKAKLGVEVDNYESCNFDVNGNFMLAGDWMKPYYRSVTDLLEKDVPVLIYAGDKDFICNWLGNQAWTDKLPWSGADKFAEEEIRDWKVGKTHAGEVKNYKHFTFLRVFGAGHMVPFDQPENSLDMVNRWISGDFRF